MKRPTVLWISRHKPLKVQVDKLKEKLKDFDLIVFDKFLPTAQDVIKLAHKVDADIVVPVLPLSFVQKLVEEAKDEGFIILFAEMEHVHNCDSLPCPSFKEETDSIVETRSGGKIIYRHYRFKQFSRIKDIQIVKEPW